MIIDLFFIMAIATVACLGREAIAFTVTTTTTGTMPSTTVFKRIDAPTTTTTLSSSRRLSSRFPSSSSVSKQQQYPCWRNGRQSKRRVVSGGSTQLTMYDRNLPPSGGGGGGNNNNDIGGILRSALSVGLTIGFFLSPIGGFVLRIFDSVLVLSIVLLASAFLGWTIWVSLNTIEGQCPSCGFPVRVYKSSNKDVYTDMDKTGTVTDLFSDIRDSPKPCLNCGAMLRASDDNTAIENVSGRTNIDDLSSMNGPGGGPSFFDFFSETTTSTTTKTVDGNVPPTTPSNKKKNRKDDTGFIDVDVIQDD